MILATIVTDIGNSFSDVVQRFGLNWPQFIAQAINFCIVAAVLWFFASKPIIKILSERKQRITQSMADAEAIKKELASTDAKRQEILMKANEEAKALIMQAREAAARLEQQESQRALKEAESILAKAKEASEADYQKMLAELKNELSRLVVATTAKVIGKVLSPEEQKRLNAEALAQLKQADNK